MASVVKNIEYIKNHFEDHSDFILNKINKENISISHKSTNFVSDIAYTISNYVDFINNGSYLGLDKISLLEMKEKYSQQLKEWSKNYPENNYVEKNEILIDYRVNNIGYYWVDLKTHFSYETAFRLNNCGRVNTYQNLLELREFNELGFNYSWIVLVMNKDGLINQIRGNYNKKPEQKYNNFVFDFLMRYNKVNGFKIVGGKNDDLTISDLSADQIKILKEKRPELFKMSLL